jgi:hypothetical protein
MTTKKKAEELVNSYRIILMNEDTECGNEILCTSIAKQCALIAVDEIISTFQIMGLGSKFYENVKEEIEKL